MDKILTSWLKQLIWLVIPILITGCIASLDQHQQLQGDHFVTASEIAENIKSNIKNDSRNGKFAWKAYANGYITFVDQTIDRVNKKEISNINARKILIKSYDLFQSGSYSPRKASMLYSPSNEKPDKEQPWLPEIPPSM